ncbi:MAG: DUF1829 domain-containing protein [Balneolales bacterium]
MQLEQSLKESYINWLNKKITVGHINDVIEMTSPLMDRHNDHLQIYVVPDKDKFKLTDDGYIINDLVMSGCDIFSSQRRIDIFNKIINGYGVKKSSNDELYIDSNIDDFPQKKHMLLQAMLSVDDMFMLSRPNVKNIFVEDVENFFINHSIRYTENISFTGVSGFAHKFDFVISRSNKKPERIIKTLNNPTRNTSESLLFAWNETRETRKKDSTLLAFLNDGDKKISSELLNAYPKYDVVPVLWSNRNNIIDELTA